MLDQVSFFKVTALPQSLQPDAFYYVLDGGAVSGFLTDENGITAYALGAAQVNADWDATSGPAKILNKPAIYAFSGTSSQYTKGDGTYGTLPPVAVPGGSNGSIQYSESAAFTGDSNLTWDPTSHTLQLSSSGDAAIENTVGAIQFVSPVGPAMQITATGVVLIGTTTSVSSAYPLQVGGPVVIDPIGGVGGCLQLGDSGFINPEMSFVGTSAEAPGFQAWQLLADTTGNFRINEGISGAMVAVFSVLNGIAQMKSFGAFYPGEYSTANRLALSVTTSAIVYDTDLNKLCVFTGTAWEVVQSV